MTRIEWAWIGGRCPSQGYGTIEVGGTRHDVYFRSRHGYWTLAIGRGEHTSATAPPWERYVGTGAVWAWSGTDGTAWGLGAPSVRELGDLLTAEPVEAWPRADADVSGCVTVARHVRLPGGVVDYANE